MKEREKKEFIAIVAVLLETYQREATEGLYMGYWTGLNDLPLGAVKFAVNEAIKKSKFCPSPAELREYAGVQEGEARAISAYGDLLEAVKDVGCYGHVDFADKAINAAVRLCGGWIAVCDRFAEGQSKEKWIKMEFVKAYQASASRPLGDEESRPHAGLTEKVVNRRGELVDPIPRVIGTARGNAAIAIEAPKPSPAVEATSSELTVSRN